MKPATVVTKEKDGKVTMVDNQIGPTSYLRSDTYLDPLGVR